MGPGRAEADKGRPEVRRWDCAYGAAAPGRRVAAAPGRHSVAGRHLGQHPADTTGPRGHNPGFSGALAGIITAGAPLNRECSRWRRLDCGGKTRGRPPSVG